MELREYIRLLRKNIGAVIVLVLFGALLSLLISAKLPSGYSQSQTFYIVAPKETSREFYDYEGYFGQQKARDFTDTAVVLLGSDDFRREVNISDVSLTARKVAPQVIKLTTTAKSASEAKDALEKTSQSFNQKLVSLAGQDQALQIKPVGQVQPGYFTSPNKKILAVFGASLGFVFAVLVISLKTYFKV